MRNLLFILKNKIVLATVISLLAVSVICAFNLTSRLNSMDRIQSQLDAMDWVIPLGTYESLYAAEVQGNVYFAAEQGKDVTILDAEGKPAAEMAGLAEARDCFYKLEVLIHPEGYWIDLSSAGYQKIRTCDESQRYFDGYIAGSSLILADQPGLAYTMTGNGNTAVNLKTGKVIYTAKSDERIVRQDGEFWIMEREIPWSNAALTLTYLRDMNFEMALDGMLFDGIWDIDGDHIAGAVITTGTYDQLPEEVIAVENCILDTSGNVLYSDADTESGDLILLGADEGYFFTMENHERYRMHFSDGSGSLDFAEGHEPVGPCRDGLFAFTTGEDRYGFKNKDGETVIPAIFDMVSQPHQGLAAVQRGRDVGVIRLEGGADYEN